MDSSATSYCSLQTSTQNIVEEASTHKSLKTHAGNVFVTRNIELLTF